MYAGRTCYGKPWTESPCGFRRDYALRKYLDGHETGRNLVDHYGELAAPDPLSGHFHLEALGWCVCQWQLLSAVSTPNGFDGESLQVGEI